MSEPCKHWFEGMVARSETECPFCRYEQAERDRDEAVRLLREARTYLEPCIEPLRIEGEEAAADQWLRLIDAIDAYLAKAKD